MASIGAFRQRMGRIVGRGDVRPRGSQGTAPQGAVGARPPVEALADRIRRRAVPVAVAHAVAGGVGVPSCYRRSAQAAAVVRIVLGIVGIMVVRVVGLGASVQRGNAQNEERQREQTGW